MVVLAVSDKFRSELSWETNTTQLLQSKTVADTAPQQEKKILSSVENEGTEETLVKSYATQVPGQNI